MNKSLDLSICPFHMFLTIVFFFFFACSFSNAYSIFFEGFMGTVIVLLVCYIERACWMGGKMALSANEDAQSEKASWSARYDRHKQHQHTEGTCRQGACCETPKKIKGAYTPLAGSTAKFSEETDKVRITLDLGIYVWRTGNHLESKAMEENPKLL